MTNTNPEVKIKCRLRSGRAYGNRMGLTVIANSNLIYQSNQLCDDTLDLEFVSNLPLTLEFQVYGKTPGDTEVDHEGRILRDKCVILDGLSINDMWIKKWMLENKLISFCPDSARPRINNYFGQNGVASFNIPQSNLLEFWLDVMTVDH